jgi:hypothetical protein
MTMKTHVGTLAMDQPAGNPDISVTNGIAAQPMLLFVTVNTISLVVLDAQFAIDTTEAVNDGARKVHCAIVMDVVPAEVFMLCTVSDRS